MSIPVGELVSMGDTAMPDGAAEMGLSRGLCGRGKSES
jgi:hypothetical protein